MSWRTRIPGCFGDMDGLFAVHAMDAKRALELLVAAKEQRVSRDDFFGEFEEYLRSTRVEHFDEQMERIYAHYSAWF